MCSGSFLHDRKGTVTTLEGRPFAPGRVPFVKVLACFFGRSFLSPPSTSSLLRFLSGLGRFSAGLAVPFCCWLEGLGRGGGVPGRGVDNRATTGCTAIESMGGAGGADGAGEATRGVGRAGAVTDIESFRGGGVGRDIGPGEETTGEAAKDGLEFNLIFLGGGGSGLVISCGGGGGSAGASGFSISSIFTLGSVRKDDLNLITVDFPGFRATTGVQVPGLGSDRRVAIQTLG